LYLCMTGGARKTSKVVWAWSTLDSHSLQERGGSQRKEEFVLGKARLLEKVPLSSPEGDGTLSIAGLSPPLSTPPLSPPPVGVARRCRRRPCLTPCLESGSGPTSPRRWCTSGDDGPARLGVVGAMVSTRQGLRDARVLAGYYLA
jgi:hypothetical protein